MTALLRSQLPANHTSWDPHPSASSRMRNLGWPVTDRIVENQLWGNDTVSVVGQSHKKAW